jgi:hypothetical protein
VYVTEHFAVASSVHVVELNVPEALLAQVTVPVGVLFAPALVSATVAVQVVVTPTATVLGAQVTTVDVDRFVTVTPVVPVLPRCSVSAP